MLFRNITPTLFKFNPDPTDLVTLFIQLFTADTQCSRTMKGVEYNPFMKAVVILWAISLDQLCYEGFWFLCWMRRLFSLVSFACKSWESPHIATHCT